MVVPHICIGEECRICWREMQPVDVEAHQRARMAQEEVDPTDPSVHMVHCPWCTQFFPATVKFGFDVIDRTDPTVTRWYCSLRCISLWCAGTPAKRGRPRKTPEEVLHTRRENQRARRKQGKIPAPVRVIAAPTVYPSASIKNLADLLKKNNTDPT